jgi:hypothetical protein
VSVTVNQHTLSGFLPRKERVPRVWTHIDVLRPPLLTLWPWGRQIGSYATRNRLESGAGA